MERVATEKGRSVTVKFTVEEINNLRRLLSTAAQEFESLDSEALMGVTVKDVAHLANSLREI